MTELAERREFAPVLAAFEKRLRELLDPDFGRSQYGCDRYDACRIERQDA